MKTIWSVNFILLVAVVVSAVATVYSVHRNRSLFAELQESRHQADQLNVTWGKLQLEESTWATRARIQQLARSKLDMKVPDKVERVVVKP